MKKLTGLACLALLFVLISSLAACSVSPIEGVGQRKEQNFTPLSPEIQAKAEEAFVEHGEIVDLTYFWKNPRQLSLRFSANAYHPDDLQNYRFVIFDLLSKDEKYVGEAIYDLKLQRIHSAGGHDSDPLDGYRGMLINALAAFKKDFPTISDSGYKIVVDGLRPVFVFPDGKAWVDAGQPLVERNDRKKALPTG
ncbi:MAG: hypothetical protein GX900_03285 [Clostridiaceae bacterium]|nr:hypothetical protein [Clostridiaceae bacterium]